MNSLAIIVTTAPNNHLTETALQLIEQALEQQLSVLGVFFYQAGVLNASDCLVIPNDEYPLLARWKKLNHSNNVPLYLCSTAAEKHGLINVGNEKASHIDNAFTIAGLGELVELHSKAKRVLQL